MSGFQIFTLPSQQALDTAANVLSGATLTFSLTSTSTPTNAYSDSSLSTPVANPLSANAAGVFIPVFLDPAIIYRVVLKTAAGAVLQTWDPANEQLLSQAIIAGLLWPRTQPEVSATVTPINYSRFPSPWKDISRFVSDNTGLTDVAAQFRNAIAAEKNIIIPEGTYRFDSEVIVGRDAMRIEGAGKGNTFLVLNAAAGAGKALLRWSSILSHLDMAHLQIQIAAANKALGQIGLRFAEAHYLGLDSVIVQGPNAAADTTVAVQFDGSGTYTGETTIDRCYFLGTKIGVDFRLVGTSARVTNTEFIAFPGIAGSRGVKIAAGCAGITLEKNSFQQYERGIYSEGTYLTQALNRYEGNTVNWEWVRGTSPRIWAAAIHENQVSGGAPVYPKNNFDICVDVGRGTTYFDNMYIETGLGFRERLRTFSIGEFVTPAYSAGSFTANGTQTWTVDSGDVNTYAYTIVGTMMTVIFQITSTVVGGVANTQLRIAIPGGYSAVKTVTNDCTVTNGAATARGFCGVTAAGTVIIIGKDLLASTNFSAGATDVYGQLTFEVQ
jgi:hypothetical protein